MFIGQLLEKRITRQILRSQDEIELLKAKATKKDVKLYEQIECYIEIKKRIGERVMLNRYLHSLHQPNNGFWRSVRMYLNYLYMRFQYRKI